MAAAASYIFSDVNIDDKSGSGTSFSVCAKFGANMCNNDQIMAVKLVTKW